MKVRKTWIREQDQLPVSTQCALAGVNWSGCYGPANSSTSNAKDLDLLILIDEEYTRHPFYGSRRMKRLANHVWSSDVTLLQVTRRALCI